MQKNFSMLMLTKTKTSIIIGFCFAATCFGITYAATANQNITEEEKWAIIGGSSIGSFIVSSISSYLISQKFCPENQEQEEIEKSNHEATDIRI